MPMLSILIVTYNNEATIEDCINSIQNYNDISNELEIIVVDNGSKDKTCEILSEYQENHILKYIQSTNKGFGAGNNIAFYNSTAKNIFFLNPDTILIEPIFKKILHNIELHPNEIGGFHLIDINGNDSPSFGVMPEFLRLYNLNKRYYKKLKKKDIILKNRFPWGASMYMSRKIFSEAGMFDDRYFLNFEEADLVHRLNDKKIIINKEKIIHLESVSKPKGDVSLKFYFESEKKYFDKYYNNSYYANYKKQMRKKIILKKIIFSIIGKSLSDFDLKKLSYYES